MNTTIELYCINNNPCGDHGYCRDKKDGSWVCECKFWWTGTTCDTQTSSGVQVIVLGSLLGALIILFYTLQIIRRVRKKRQQPPKVEEKKKEFPQDKLMNLALKSARRLAGLRSCITALMTCLVAAGALLGKWALLQPIHNEVAQKYLAQEPIYYDQNSFCGIIDLEDFNVLTFPVACFLILVFIVRTKRTRIWRDKCGGYMGVPMPVDFLSHVDRKFAAFVFAICVDSLIYILQQVISGDAPKVDGVILTYLLRLTQVFFMSIRYFPFLAAVYLNTTMTLGLTAIYAWFDFAVDIVNQALCQSQFYPSYDEYLNNASSITEMFDYYGTGPALVAIDICTDIPRFVCLAYISVKLPSLFIQKLYYRFKKDVSVEKRRLMKLSREERLFIRVAKENSMEMLYVKNLFRGPKNRLRSESIFARIIPKFIYDWRDDFQFSARITCVYSSLLLLLYYVTIQACIQVVPLLSALQQGLQQLADVVTNLFDPPEVIVGADGEQQQLNARTSNFPMPNLIRPYVFAIQITFVIIVLQLLVLLANMRRNLFQAYRGDDAEIPRRQRSKYISYSSGNVHFAGYFIGYLIWGYIIIAVLAMILCFAIEAAIVYGSVRILEIILKRIIPGLLFVFFKQYLNKFLAQYVFLQHQGEVLALNNRRVLMVFIYFNFFLDAFLGFVSSILRLVKSVIGGILYMCRLDYSPLGRKLEGFDGGFSSYCGFIHTECTHRHPVMLVFVSFLYNQMKIKREAMGEFHHDGLDKGGKYLVSLKPSKSDRYRRKWKLAIFLVRNPSIVFFRKAYLNQFHLDELHPFSDSENRQQAERKMSAYARRMSVYQTTGIVDKDFKPIVQDRF